MLCDLSTPVHYGLKSSRLPMIQIINKTISFLLVSEYFSYDFCPFYQIAQVTKLTATIVGVFYICYVPFLITLGTGPSMEETYLYALYITMMFYFNNRWVNPVLYAWMNPPFRAALKSLVCFWRTPAMDSGLHSHTHSTKSTHTNPHLQMQNQ